MKSLLARIDSAAETAGLSRSEWIRRCCAEATTALIDAAGHDLDDAGTSGLRSTSPASVVALKPSRLPWVSMLPAVTWTPGCRTAAARRHGSGRSCHGRRRACRPRRHVCR